MRQIGPFLKLELFAIFAIIAYLSFAENTIAAGDSSEGKVTTVFLAGDSTMATKESSRKPETGWGESLPKYLGNSIVVKNHAVNGRSTKSFIDEGRWNEIVEAINQGDIVVIQFGHNDQKIKDPSRYTEPWGRYSENLRRFVVDVRARNGIPVLASSICRRKFDSDSGLIDTHGEYPNAVAAVASEMSVPFVDMETASAGLLSGLGPVESKKLFLHLGEGQHVNYPDGKEDDTHLNTEGATVHARLFVEALARQAPLLAEAVLKGD